MVKKSIKNISLVSLGNIFNAVLGFAFVTAVAKALDLDSFGRYALLTTLLVTFSKTVDFGTNSVFVTKSIILGKKTLTDTFYTLKIILLLIAIPVSYIVLTTLGFKEVGIIVTFILGLIAYTVNYSIQAIFQKSERYTELVLVNTLPGLVKGLASILIFLNLLDINLTLVFSIFSLSIFSSSLLVPLVPKDSRKFKFTPKGILPMLNEAYPGGISQLVQEGWSSINNVITKGFSTFSNVGVFSLADKISQIFRLASVSTFTVLLPKSSKLKRDKGTYDFKEIGTISVAILLIAFLATFIASFFVEKIFGAKFEGSISILGVLIFANAFTAIHMFIEHIFYVEEKTKYIMYINLSKLGVFLISCLVLIPSNSLYGLSISNLIAGIFGVAATIFFLKLS